MVREFAAHILHSSAHTLHTKKPFAHKTPILHTLFRKCTQENYKINY